MAIDARMYCAAEARSWICGDFRSQSKDGRLVLSSRMARAFSYLSTREGKTAGEPKQRNNESTGRSSARRDISAAVGPRLARRPGIRPSKILALLMRALISSRRLLRIHRCWTEHVVALSYAVPLMTACRYWASVSLQILEEVSS